MSHSWASSAASSSVLSGVFKMANYVSWGFTDLSRYNTFEAFVAAYGKHMRDQGENGGAVRAFVPIGSLLNYHPPDLDSHFSGSSATKTKQSKKNWYELRKTQLSAGLASKAEEQMMHTVDEDVTYDFIQNALDKNMSFYAPCRRHDSNEVVLFLTDSFFQKVAESLKSDSNKPIESVALFLKTPIHKESLIHFEDASPEEVNYHMLDQADFHIILDGQNRYQIIKQVLTHFVQNNWLINGKKVHQIYIETLSYNYIKNDICDMALQIRNKSLKCDWFATFPQSNVPGTLNRNQSREDYLRRAEVSHCSLTGKQNAVSPYDDPNNFVNSTYTNCVRRSAP